MIESTWTDTVSDYEKVNPSTNLEVSKIICTLLCQSCHLLEINAMKKKPVYYLSNLINNALMEGSGQLDIRINILRYCLRLGYVGFKWEKLGSTVTNTYNAMVRLFF